MVGLFVRSRPYIRQIGLFQANKTNLDIHSKILKKWGGKVEDLILQMCVSFSYPQRKPIEGINRSYIINEKE